MSECRVAINLLDLALIYVVTLSTHGPYSPVHSDHDAGIKVARLPFETAERVLTRTQQDVVFPLDAVDGVETVDVPLDVSRRESGDEQGTLGGQHLLKGLFPFQLSLDDLATVRVDRIPPRRRRGEPEARAEGEKDVGVRVERTELLVDRFVRRLQRRQGQRGRYGHGVCWYTVSDRL